MRLFYKTLSMNMFNKQKKINSNQFLQACLPVIHCLRSSGVASTSWKVMSLMKLSNLSRRVWNVPTVYGRASPSPGCSAISDIVWKHGGSQRPIGYRTQTNRQTDPYCLHTHTHCFAVLKGVDWNLSLRYPKEFISVCHNGWSIYHIYWSIWHTCTVLAI